MPRLPRLDFAGIPQHVVQRGNDRQPCFADVSDYLRYLKDLGDAATRFGCAIHAYVLMTNHVHLLVTPSAKGGVSEMMQALGRRYVGYFNTRHGRTGTLWEGRFKACLVDTERYLLTCYRYIELNPVRAGIVATAEAYRWSSYHCNALGQADGLITPHATYVALGIAGDDRYSAYSALVAQGLCAARIDEVRSYLRQQRVLGTERFQAEIATLSGRTVVVRARGRQPASSLPVCK